jgi:hypothetical protein
MKVFIFYNYKTYIVFKLLIMIAYVIKIKKDIYL